MTLQSQALPVFQDYKVPQTRRKAFMVWKWLTQLLAVYLNDLRATDMSKSCQSLKQQTMHSRTAEASEKHKSLDHFNYKRTRMVTFFLLYEGPYFILAQVMCTSESVLAACIPTRWQYIMNDMPLSRISHGHALSFFFPRCVKLSSLWILNRKNSSLTCACTGFVQLLECMLTLYNTVLVT